MKHIINLLIALMITVSSFATITVKKEGGAILVGGTYLNPSQLIFFYSGNNVFYYDGGSKQNQKIGLYTEIVTVAGATFANADEACDYLNSLLKDEPYNYAIAFAEMINVTSVYKFGHNNAVGTSEEVIWDGGGEYTFLDSAEYMNVKSDSIQDGDSLDHAWTVMIYGLDSAFNQINELVRLNGTTNVKTTKKYLRVFRAFVIQAGTITTTNGNNIGNITITSFTTSTKQAQIIPGSGQTLMCVYTVPAGYTAYITGYSLSCGQGKQVLFKSKFRNCMTTNCAFSVKDIREIYESTVFGQLETPLAVPEKTDIVITGQVATGTVTASASFGLILRKN